MKVSRMLLDRLRPLQADTVYLANPVFDRDEILSAITRDLMTEPPRVNRTQSLAVLETALIERYAKGRRVVVVIDEAHSMPGPTLEEIRLLSNLETSHHKLLKIVLFGQPELDELLNLPRLRQVKDRVSHRFELPPLNAEEASAYLTFRLQKAGWQGGELFDAPALKLLVQVSEGRTRKLNMLADKSMLAAYSDGVARVGITQVRRACGDNLPSAKQAMLFAAPTASNPLIFSGLRAFALPAAGMLAALGIGYIIGTSSSHPAPLGAKPAPAVAANNAPSSDVSGSFSAPVSTDGLVAASIPNTISPNNTVSALQQVTTTQISASAIAGTLSAAAPPEANPSLSDPGKANSFTAQTDAQSSLRSPLFETRRAATDQFFADPKIQGFTVQVLAQRAPKAVEAMAVALDIQASLDDLPQSTSALARPFPVLIHDRLYQQQLFHAIYVGHFETRTEAVAFIESAPASVTRYKPIVRSMEAIRKESSP